MNMFVFTGSARRKSFYPKPARRFREFLLLLALLSLPASAGWVRVGTGDCPGPLLQASQGETPDPSRCTQDFAGKTSLCYTQVCFPGCDYVDLPTSKCQGGAELAHVYTCQPDSPAR